MQKRGSKSESTEKLSKTGPVENFWLWSKSTVNGWCGSVTSPRAYVAGREAQQARGARGWAWDWRVRRVADTGSAWWRVLVRQELQPARGGACDAVSGRSWLGFARDWPFCLPMPFLWLLNEQNVDIRELQVLWVWRRWLAFDSDYRMKARAAEERRKYPQEPESQRNGSDTMLTI